MKQKSAAVYLKSKTRIYVVELIECNNQQREHSEVQAEFDKGITVEQQKLNNNIVIRGVELDDNSSESELLKIYNNICEHFGIIDVNDFKPVTASLLLPRRSESKPKNTSKTIQVQLSSVTAKRHFLQIRRVKKDILPTDIGLTQNSRHPILITEQLTKSNQELLFFARSLKGTHNYKFVWSCNGQILARARKNSKVIRIKDINHINQLKAEINLHPLVSNGRFFSRADLQPDSGNTST